MALWALVIAIGRVWGMGLEADGRRLVLFAPPLLAGYRLEPAPYLWIGVLAGLAAVVIVPVLASRLQWGLLLSAMPVASLGWALGLAAVDGTVGLTGGLGWDTEFKPFVSRAGAHPTEFLRGFVTDIRS